VPVVAGAILFGLPTSGQLAGLVLGLVGIGLVGSLSPSLLAGAGRPFPLALAAGLGFGGFFITIAQVQPSLLFGPLAIAKLTAFVMGVAILAARREPILTQRVSPPVLVAGVFDAGGNLFYLLASQLADLGIAAVISSMAPGTTVLLARSLQQERVSTLQWAGIAACLGAVALIAVS
jgi:drug/metabolite transporter (DMT)-like permease